MAAVGVWKVWMEATCNRSFSVDFMSYNCLDGILRCCCSWRLDTYLRWPASECEKTNEAQSCLWYDLATWAAVLGINPSLAVMEATCNRSFSSAAAVRGAWTDFMTACWCYNCLDGILRCCCSWRLDTYLRWPASECEKE